MGQKERDAIKEYLVEKLQCLGEFSQISMDYSPLDGGARDPERKRHILCEKVERKYLISVHSHPDYNHGVDAFLQILRHASLQGIACVSVFDDSVFYRKDKDLQRPRAPQIGNPEKERQRIKLLGLERYLQEFGELTYYKSYSRKLEVVSFTKGVIADYSSSESEAAREWIKQRELLTVMEPTVERSLDSFTLDIEGTKRGIRLAKFVPSPSFSDTRTQYIIDEIHSGNTDIHEQMTGEDFAALARRGIRY